ncbi:MAG: transcriptional repressor LexA [Deltaproteobacteria bacterium]|nr:transcriptional repressor LexA [Deltaproteobacteria bacterium]
MKELTDRQRQLLSYIEDHLHAHGFPPSIREMADHMGIRSTNGVNDHLKALERKGYVSRERSLKSRAISVLASSFPGHRSIDDEPLVSVPILGQVAAGVPVLSEENFEGNLPLGQSLLPRDHKVFALKVRGDSMIEKGILDGDTVIVHSQQTADSGQIVVAMVEGEATVKTFKSSSGAIRLEPANPAFKPIVIHPKDFKTTTILGVVTGVFRQI